MDADVLQALLGGPNRWYGPCTVVIDAGSTLHSYGADGIAGGGAKVYAPRYVTGRVFADAVALVQNGKALLIIQHPKVGKTAEEGPRPALTVADPEHVVALEFPDYDPVAAFGMLAPPPPRPSGFIPRPNLPPRPNG
jgi:hypothetical protein